MKPDAQSSVQIYDELERREAGMGRPPRGRARRTSRSTTSMTSASTTAAAATVPRSASGGSSSATAERHFCPHRG